MHAVAAMRLYVQRQRNGGNGFTTSHLYDCQTGTWPCGTHDPCITQASSSETPISRPAVTGPVSRVSPEPSARNSTFPSANLLCSATNHLDEARGITNWLARALPRAEKYATEGLTLHNTTVKYSGGAKYSTLMGYDGTVTIPPTENEGANAYSNYPGANAAAMALAYTDWAADGEYDDIAKRILKGTTRVSLEDLQWREDFGGYLDRHSPSAVQQSAAIFGLRESLRRGVAEPGWKDMATKIILPTADFHGSQVITAGAGAVPFDGFGDACWLQGLWWYGNISADDPLARSTYEMISKSLTGNYVFNNAWLGVYAAKLNKGDDAYAWVRHMLQPGVNLFDDTCLGEIVHGTEDFKKTPEIAAHAASRRTRFPTGIRGCATRWPSVGSGRTVTNAPFATSWAANSRAARTLTSRSAEC